MRNLLEKSSLIDFSKAPEFADFAIRKQEEQNSGY